jgi:FkbM family methyltransferase
MTLARFRYYVVSLATLLLGVRNLPTVAWALLARRQPFTVRLRAGYAFCLRSALDLLVLKEVILDREYQQLGPEVAAGWTVVDIGAAHGEFAIPAARRIGTGRIIAVEPAPDTIELLRGNLLLNGVGRVEILPVAVGAHDGSATLSLADRGAVMNSTAGSTAGAARIEVPMVTLTQLLDVAGIGQCDYMKMDCEGGEYDILLPAPDATLRRITRLCLEYHEGVTTHTCQDLLRRLAAAGFATRSLAHPANPQQGWIYAQQDHVAARPGRYEERMER